MQNKNNYVLIYHQILQIYDIFGAGVDTGQTFPLWFFSYCTVFTGEMKKAQDELDRFVDKNRRMPKYVIVMLIFALRFYYKTFVSEPAIKITISRKQYKPYVGCLISVKLSYNFFHFVKIPNG